LNFATDTALPDHSETSAMPPFTIEELAVHFPHLEIIEFLGRGGMGVVYKARQKSLGRVVALKLLAPERADDPQFSKRFSQEAQALAALSHPKIVTIHDFGQAGGFYYGSSEKFCNTTAEVNASHEAWALCHALEFSSGKDLLILLWSWLDAA